MPVPRARELGAKLFAREREALGRPLLKALVEQRQVEQPLTGVIDDVEGQCAVRAILPLVVDHQPQLADVGCRVRPVPFLDQGADVVLIGEAWHRIVRLRLQPGAGDPPRGVGLEHRKPAAAGEAMDQRGDEHRLAGARQAGDAEPDRRIEQVVAIVPQRPRRQARFLDDICKTGSHAGRERSRERQWAERTIRKSGDCRAKIKLLVASAVHERFVDLVRPMIYRSPRT